MATASCKNNRHRGDVIPCAQSVDKYIAPRSRRLTAGPSGLSRPGIRRCGEVAEWSKAHAWKVCRRGTVSRVRIPFSPPLTYWFVCEIWPLTGSVLKPLNSRSNLPRQMLKLSWRHSAFGAEQGAAASILQTPSSPNKSNPELCSNNIRSTQRLATSLHRSSRTEVDRQLRAPFPPFMRLRRVPKSGRSA